mmetsp:Transcript_132427/g.423863  ORF Transcript_132427/g.423863 Transcript_132427/m.423863 type:complete len:202 (+) Transcript_132427:351-956(+)
MGNTNTVRGDGSPPIADGTTHQLLNVLPQPLGTQICTHSTLSSPSPCVDDDHEDSSGVVDAGPPLLANASSVNAFQVHTERRPPGKIQVRHRDELTEASICASPQCQALSPTDCHKPKVMSGRGGFIKVTVSSWAGPKERTKTVLPMLSTQQPRRQAGTTASLNGCIHPQRVSGRSSATTTPVLACSDVSFASARCPEGRV